MNKTPKILNLIVFSLQLLVCSDIFAAGGTPPPPTPPVGAPINNGVFLLLGIALFYGIFQLRKKTKFMYSSK